MIANIIKKGDKNVKVQDLTDKVKGSPRINECGAIFSFEGIVRGKERGKNTEKMDLSTPNREESEKELKKIINQVKEKYGVMEIAVVHYLGEFMPGDPLFLAVVAGPHRGETLGALNELIERVKYELDFKKEDHTDIGTDIIMSGG